MAKSITIRNVPDQVRDELAARAGRMGQSLQEYLRAELIQLAEKPSVDHLMERVRARKAATGSNVAAEAIVRYVTEERR